MRKLLSKELAYSALQAARNVDSNDCGITIDDLPLCFIVNRFVAKSGDADEASLIWTMLESSGHEPIIWKTVGVEKKEDFAIKLLSFQEDARKKQLFIKKYAERMRWNKLVFNEIKALSKAHNVDLKNPADVAAKNELLFYESIFNLFHFRPAEYYGYSQFETEKSIKEQWTLIRPLFSRLPVGSGEAWPKEMRHWMMQQLETACGLGNKEMVEKVLDTFGPCNKINIGFAANLIYLLDENQGKGLKPPQDLISKIAGWLHCSDEMVIDGLHAIWAGAERINKYNIKMWSFLYEKRGMFPTYEESGIGSAVGDGPKSFMDRSKKDTSDSNQINVISALCNSFKFQEFGDLKGAGVEHCYKWFSPKLWSFWHHINPGEENDRTILLVQQASITERRRALAL